MKNTISALALMSAMALGTEAVAMGDPALTNGDDLVIAEGATFELPGGIHVFDDLVIAEGATLVVTAGTSITANRLHVDGGTVAYKPGSSQNVGVPTLQMIVFDAQAVQQLAVVGNGADGAGHLPDMRAADGHAGRGACSRHNPFDWCDRSADPGGPGQAGAAGAEGENALQAAFYLVGLTPGAVIEYEAVGGAGGRGQDGGNGGPGGGGSSFHTGKAGGNGGNGGQGGEAGDSGKITVYLVADDSDEKIQSDWIKVIANVAAGVPGAGGLPGSAGRNGAVCSDITVGNCRALGASDGQHGLTGNQGAGPVSGGTEDYATVNIMSRETFAEFALAHKVFTD